MKGDITNRVANSALITIDLSDYRPNESIIEFDVKDFLFEGIILKEKTFRSSLKELDLTKYENKIIALFCSEDVVIPMWAYMLIVSYLNPVCLDVHFGRKEDVLQKMILQNINLINAGEFKNQKVIIKGCGGITINESLYIAITKKLQKSVTSLMFGEACSAVPVYKNKKMK